MQYFENIDFRFWAGMRVSVDQSSSAGCHFFGDNQDKKRYENKNIHLLKKIGSKMAPKWRKREKKDIFDVLT